MLFDETEYDAEGRPVIEGVTWYDGEPLDLDAVYNEAVRLAEESPDTRKACVYSHGGVPECIVGQAVANVTGKVVSDVTHSGTIMLNEYWITALGGDLNAPKFQFLSKLQREQDGGASWGEALRVARIQFQI